MLLFWLQKYVWLNVYTLKCIKYCPSAKIAYRCRLMDSSRTFIDRSRPMEVVIKLRPILSLNFIKGQTSIQLTQDIRVRETVRDLQKGITYYKNIKRSPIMSFILSSSSEPSEDGWQTHFSCQPVRLVGSRLKIDDDRFDSKKLKRISFIRKGSWKRIWKHLFWRATVFLSACFLGCREKQK